MPEQLFANVASTTLNGAITSSQTSITVTSTANFPAASTSLEKQFRAAFVDAASPPNVLEYIAVTNVSGQTWTVTRQAEDPGRFPATSQASGTRVIMMVTRGVLESFEIRSKAFGHNLLDYGAKGDGNHLDGTVGTDDIDACEAADAAAHSTNGFGLISAPGGNTFRLTREWKIRQSTEGPVHLVGLGGFNNNGQPQPSFVWGGATDGTVMSMTTTGQNVQASPIKNIRVLGFASAATLIRYGPDLLNNPAASAKMDLGSYLEDVWLQNCRGDALRIDGSGVTNGHFKGGRFDSISGYMIYIRQLSRSSFGVEKMTYDNAGAPNGNSPGFMHIDGASVDTTGFMDLSLIEINGEMNADWLETDATGTDPADRRGAIHITVNPASLRCQVMVSGHHFKAESLSGSRASSSIFMAHGGTLVQRTPRFAVAMLGVTGCFGAGTATLGHLKPVGNVSSTAQPTVVTANYGALFYGPPGDNVEATNQVARFFNNMSAA